VMEWVMTPGFLERVFRHEQVRRVIRNRARGGYVCFGRPGGTCGWVGRAGGAGGWPPPPPPPPPHPPQLSSHIYLLFWLVAIG
jgi:hypothetical protein